ncbi:MAG: acetolactate decarboxylase [Deltaproteobacteria bacterium]|nr:acetolactate decarboxylase [Deltaproteobacteria bacterium]
MKKFIVALLALLLVLGCAPSIPPNSVTQTSTIDALLAGVYDGEMTCGELLRYGDLGIGTFDRLDGEMVILDGIVYQVRSDGGVYRPAAATRTPFATVCRFGPEQTVPLTQKLDFAGLRRVLDTHIPDPHRFYAFRITGQFSKMRTRSVPAQQKPYPVLAEVAKTQPEFEMTDISGTIVGFRCPSFVKGINVPGYHLHFLSADRRKGGHILGFELVSGCAEIGAGNRFMLIMPKKSEQLNRLDLSRDRSAELERVEK